MTAPAATWEHTGEVAVGRWSIGVHELGSHSSLEPVVLAHGLEDDWRSWMPLGARLYDAGLRPVALDLPWRAGNDYTWRHTHPPGRWLAAAARAVNGRPVVWVGHSFGANAVLELLADEHEGVERPHAVGLCAPFFRSPELAVDWRLFEASRDAFHLVIREGLRVRLGCRAAAMDPRLLTSMALKAADRIGPRGFLALFEAFTRSCDLGFDDVAAAVLVLAGSTDPGIHGARAVALDAALPDVRIRFHDDYGHFCHAEQPDDVARQLVEFLLPRLECDSAAGARTQTTQPEGAHAHHR